MLPNALNNWPIFLVVKSPSHWTDVHLLHVRRILGHWHQSKWDSRRYYVRQGAWNKVYGPNTAIFLPRLVSVLVGITEIETEITTRIFPKNSSGPSQAFAFTSILSDAFTSSAHCLQKKQIHALEPDLILKRHTVLSNLDCLYSEPPCWRWHYYSWFEEAKPEIECCLSRITSLPKWDILGFKPKTA